MLPLHPSLESSRSWDALADSLWQGLYELGVPRVVVLWTGSEAVRVTSPQEFDTAVEVLAALADELANPEPTDGRPVELCVYVDVDS